MDGDGEDVLEASDQVLIRPHYSGSGKDVGLVQCHIFVALSGCFHQRLSLMARIG